MKGLILSFFTLFSVLNAQSEGYFQRNFKLGLKGAQETLFESPGRAVLFAGGIGAFVAHQFDSDVQDWFLNNQPLSGNLNHFGDIYGNLYSGIIVLTTAAISSNKNGSLRQFEYAFTALGANGATTILLKEMVRRERPNGLNHRSFPSGHVSHSFATATIFKELYGWKIGSPAYGLAIIVSMNRMQDNKHYFSDVIFGASLGTAIGLGFSQVYLKENNRLNVSFNWINPEMKISWKF
jgi:membrane-associated phospholipid phosphatase|tara:strand:+ start:460 stop:1170 length:711 start_codon:yes stop_codon:yes gene_type:complete